MSQIDRGDVRCESYSAWLTTRVWLLKVNLRSRIDSRLCPASLASVFGHIFDVLTAADEPRSKIQELLPSFGRVVAGGGVEWPAEWIKRLDEYVPNGGTLVLSASLS